MDRINQYPAPQTMTPGQIAAEMNAAEARHVVGQAVMKNPRLAHLLHMVAELDNRGFEAVLACAMFHRRYPKEG